MDAWTRSSIVVAGQWKWCRKTVIFQLYDALGYHNIIFIKRFTRKFLQQYLSYCRCLVSKFRRKHTLSIDMTPAQLAANVAVIPASQIVEGCLHIASVAGTIPPSNDYFHTTDCLSWTLPDDSPNPIRWSSLNGITTMKGS